MLGWLNQDWSEHVACIKKVRYNIQYFDLKDLILHNVCEIYTQAEGSIKMSSNRNEAWSCELDSLTSGQYAVVGFVNTVMNVCVP